MNEKGAGLVELLDVRVKYNTLALKVMTLDTREADTDKINKIIQMLNNYDYHDPKP